MKAKPKPKAKREEQVWPGAKPRQSLFLTALVMQAGHVTNAAKRAKVARSEVYRWEDSDPNYRQLFERAKRQAFRVLEDEMVRRAVHGYPKGIFYQGDLVATEQQYSDGLMMMLARAGDQKYRSSEQPPPGNVGLKFEGTMEDLLALYKTLISEPE